MWEIGGIFADGLPGFRARGVSTLLLRRCSSACIFIYLLLRLLIPSSHSWFSCSASASASAALRCCGFESLLLLPFLPPPSRSQSVCVRETTHCSIPGAAAAEGFASFDPYCCCCWRVSPAFIFVSFSGVHRGRFFLRFL